MENGRKQNQTKKNYLRIEMFYKIPRKNKYKM